MLLLVNLVHQTHGIVCNGHNPLCATYTGQQKRLAWFVIGIIGLQSESLACNGSNETVVLFVRRALAKSSSWPASSG